MPQALPMGQGESAKGPKKPAEIWCPGPFGPSMAGRAAAGFRFDAGRVQVRRRSGPIDKILSGDALALAKSIKASPHQHLVAIFFTESGDIAFRERANPQQL